MGDPYWETEVRLSDGSIIRALEVDLSVDNKLFSFDIEHIEKRVMEIENTCYLVPNIDKHSILAVLCR